MTNDLDDLKAMMTAATPKPDPAKRAADLALAQKNFDAHQGSTKQPRPTPVTGLKGLWTGGKTMFASLTSRGGLTTTTALVACGFLFLTPTGQDLWQTPSLPNPLVINAESEALAAELAAAEGNFITPTEGNTPDIVVEMDEELAAPELSGRVIEPSMTAVDDSIAFAEITAAPEKLASPNATTQMLTRTPLRAQQNALADTADNLGGFAPAIPDKPISPNVVQAESFANADTNAVKVTAENPVSTFSIDVDTASYAVVRSSIMRGQLPPPDAVRIEEMINYFPYDYPAPAPDAAPFQPTVSMMPTPWNADTQLVHIALQGRLPAIEDRPPLNLVFLIDTSGSMGDPTKLPLLKKSFLLMLNQLRPEDEVAIVEYAGSAGQVLAPTPASDRAAIKNALESLGAGGSTNGQGGLEQAYAVAESMKKDGEVSRVLLATDGDFNVGLSDPGGLEDFIADKRDSGTFLSVLGFGRGNLNDQTMQTLAQNGNGTAAYIDTLSEAQKVLVDQLSGALFPIASDVKVQVEFDPSQIAEYRLIGYETRALNREDFNNDAVDAGDLGAGHTVTALYEVTPVGSPARLTDPLRYGATQVAEERDELGYLKLRYKAPGAEESHLIETPILRSTPAMPDAMFAAAIAGYGQVLRGSAYIDGWGITDAITLANANKGADPFGYRAEAVQLMRLANSMSKP